VSTLTTAVDHDLATRQAARLDGLEGEAALTVFGRARELEALGRRIAHLELGEPDFRTPAHVIDAAIRALRDGETRYTPTPGLAELRSAIAAEASARGVPATPDRVLVTPGAKPMLFYATLSVVEPGDEVLVPDPGFSAYPSVTRFAGATPVSYGLVESRRFAPDVDEIAERIKPRTRVLFLNAPHNPTGGSVDEATLERLAELVERHDLLVISDEVYGRLIYDANRERVPSLASLPGLADRTIVVDGFSKAYAMTGWRLGFGIVPPWLVESLTKLMVNAHTCTPAFVQRAGVAALTGAQDAVREMVAEFRRRRDIVVRGLASIPGVSCAEPDGAFYAFPDVSTLIAKGVSVKSFTARLLEEFDVALLPGSVFGARGGGHLRLSFAAAPATIELALSRIRQCIESLDTEGAGR
jgi:aspartate/methionine/tyrosine aminotransferase